MPPAPTVLVEPAPTPELAPLDVPARSRDGVDGDDTAPAQRHVQRALLEKTQPVRRPKSRRLLWFTLGIAFGAVGAVFVRGNPVDAFHAARTRAVDLVHTLYKPPAVIATPVATNIDDWVEPVSKDAPCPADPAKGDPCADLLAPFAPQVPTVPVDALPRAKPTLASTRRPHVAARPATPSVIVHEEPAPITRGINPNGNDPASATPGRAPADSKPVPTPPSTELPSARNDPM
jgi:hypothetical protein